MRSRWTYFAAAVIAAIILAGGFIALWYDNEKGGIKRIFGRWY